MIAISIVHIIPIFFGSAIQFTYIYFMQVKISPLSGAVSFYIWFKYTIILVIISCVLKYHVLENTEFKIYLLINTVHAL